MSGVLVGSGFGSAPPFVSQFKNAVLALHPTRYYRLGSAGANTSEPDLGSDNQPGTWSATGASQARGMVIGDATPCALLDGVAGRMSMPTTNLPTGAGAFSVGMVLQILKTAATLEMAYMLGTSGVNGQFHDWDWGTAAFEWSDGTSTIASNFTAGIISALQRPTLLIATYDGTTVTAYHNIFPYGTLVAALNTTYGGAAIGSDTAGTPARFAKCLVQDWFLVKGSALTLAQVVALNQAFRGN